MSKKAKERLSSFYAKSGILQTFLVILFLDTFSVGELYNYFQGIISFRRELKQSFFVSVISSE